MGNTCNALTETLQAEDQCFEPDTYYARMISIIQSSGMGKSRLLDEMSKRFLTVSFALRGPDDTGLPPGDDEIRGFLIQTSGKDEEHNARAVALLAATLHQCRKIPLIRNGSHYGKLTVLVF